MEQEGLKEESSVTHVFVVDLKICGDANCCQQTFVLIFFFLLLTLKHNSNGAK